MCAQSEDGFFNFLCLQVLGHQNKWGARAQDETTAILLCLFPVARVDVGEDKLPEAGNWDGSWKAAHGDSHMLHSEKKHHGWRQNCVFVSWFGDAAGVQPDLKAKLLRAPFHIHPSSSAYASSSAQLRVEGVK